MSQRTGSLWSLLSHPNIYRLQQYLWGSPQLHACTAEKLALRTGASVLDVGCGPADILSRLEQINYVGVDLSQAYVDFARRRFGARGTFLQGDIYTLPALADRRFDAILAQGVLHHLDDDEVSALFAFAADHLAPGGKVVTVDPCYCDGQGTIERFLIEHDRGRNVRDADQYAKLAGRSFGRVRAELSTRASRFPYTYCYLVAQA